MERDGQVVRNRRGHVLISDRAGLVKGKVFGHPDGFGFLRPETGNEDLFLSPKEMHKVLHGDVILARVSGVDRRGRLEASIVEVLEHGNKKVVGRLFVENDVAFIVAENKRISQDILVEPASVGSAKAGQVVVAELLSQPTKHSEPVGRIVEVLGNYADPGMEIEIALRKHDLPYEWPRDAESAAKKLGKRVEAKDLKGRRDLRSLAFVTIDGETARDFDDAVYCERGAKGFKLWVAIADVSQYVKPGDALDSEAYNRGNSVYFPRRVIPMLPEELSNELCSLNSRSPGMVCEMEVTSGGVVRAYDLSGASTRRRGCGDAGGRRDRRARGRSAGAGALVPHIRRSTKSHGAPGPARQARCHRFRVGRDADDLRCAGQDRAHRAHPEERRAPPHRGVHARGQRFGFRLPREERAAHALPRARGTDAGEARSASHHAQGLRAHAGRRRQAAGEGLCGAPEAHQGQALHRHAADRGAALAAAGGLHAGERGPLRARL